MSNATGLVQPDARMTNKNSIQLTGLCVTYNRLTCFSTSHTPITPILTNQLFYRTSPRLFTKFPSYLKFFTQFSELDIERMQENKRLLKHAVKVIETITFVVDSVGDETKINQLNEALLSLVRGHIKRKIGLTEFRNLGIVLIDFICDLNNRRGSINNDDRTAIGYSQHANKLANNASYSSTSSSQDSETMTSALDKIRASSSSSSSSEEESFVVSGSVVVSSLGHHNSENSTIGGSARSRDNDPHETTTYHNNNTSKNADDDHGDCCPSSSDQLATLDTNLLVAAWTKLYSSILDLVKREEEDSNNDATD